MFGRGLRPSTEFDCHFNIYIMEKESVWVVTYVAVGRVSLSVTTYALGWFNSLNEAKSCLENEYKELCTQGYEPSKFEHGELGWTYKSDYIITQVIISLALGV